MIIHPLTSTSELPHVRDGYWHFTGTNEHVFIHEVETVCQRLGIAVPEMAYEIPNKRGFRAYFIPPPEAAISGHGDESRIHCD